MNDLKTLLDRAAGSSAPAPDASGDLGRGRRALARTRRRRGAAGLVGVAAAGVIGIGASQRLTADGDSQLADSPGVHESDELSPAGVTAGPYSFEVTPAGWHVQGHRPGSVTFAADDGSSDPHPDAFVGKIVLLYDTGRPFGELVSHDGREFWAKDNGDSLIFSTRTRPGEPEGTLWLQVPGSVGWSDDTALVLLDGVRVREGAEPPSTDPDATYHEVPGGYLVFPGD